MASCLDSLFSLSSGLFSGKFHLYHTPCEFAWAQQLAPAPTGPPRTTLSPGGQSPAGRLASALPPSPHPGVLSQTLPGSPLISTRVPPFSPHGAAEAAQEAPAACPVLPTGTALDGRQDSLGGLAPPASQSPLAPVLRQGERQAAVP